MSSTTNDRSEEPSSKRSDRFAAVGALLQMLDEQWDDLGEHERRSAVRLSLDTLRAGER